MANLIFMNPSKGYGTKDATGIVRPNPMNSKLSFTPLFGTI
jgi:hypothetical protein